MKKIAIFSIILIAAVIGSLAFIPSAHSAVSDVKVVSYSWYFDPTGFLIVLGEVQNIGTNTISSVTVKGVADSTDGTTTTSSYPAWGQYLTPGQKAPFVLEFDSEYTQTGAWHGGVSRIALSIDSAHSTDIYVYSDIAVISDSHTLTNGMYTVSGELQNVGDETAKGVTVIATFYNSTGAVVGEGFTHSLSNSFAPNAKVSFTVQAIDVNQTNISANRQIDHYSLMVKTTDPRYQGTAPTTSPTTSPTTNPTNSTPTASPGTSSSPTNTQPTNSDNPIAIDSSTWIYAAAVVIALVAVIGAVLVLRRRKPTKTPQVAPKKGQQKAKRKK